MKKINFLLFIASIGLIVSIQANKIQDAVQELYDEIVPQHSAILEKEHALIKELTPHLGWFSTYTDEKQEALKQDPATKQFLSQFYTLNAQALAVEFCHECINKVRNPTTKDLTTCHEQWLESYDREWALENAGEIEKNIFNSDKRELRHAFHKGDRKLGLWIRAIIENE